MMRKNQHAKSILNDFMLQKLGSKVLKFAFDYLLFNDQMIALFWYELTLILYFAQECTFCLISADIHFNQQTSDSTTDSLVSLLKFLKIQFQLKLWALLMRRLVWMVPSITYEVSSYYQLTLTYWLTQITQSLMIP
jgi:hypothetical protein